MGRCRKRPRRMGERYQRSPRPGSIALNHFYDIDLIKTSPRILPVSIQSCIPQAFIRPF